MNFVSESLESAFSGFLFATAKVAYLTAKIFIHIILYSAIHIYWFSYIHNFIIILSRVYKDPIQLPAPSWLVSLIGRALHRYRRGQGFESRTSLIFFFRLSFRNCKSCVFNCDDLFSYNSSLRSSQIWFSYIHNFRIKLVYSINYNIRRTFQTSKTTIYRPHTPYDTMTSFTTTTTYYDQNPSGCSFLVQITAFVIYISLGLPHLNMKRKTKRILVVVVKWRHRANGLLESMLPQASVSKRGLVRRHWHENDF